MPYRDKDKLKEYQKNYFKKNQWSLNTKQNKRRSMTQSQSPKDSIPDSTPIEQLTKGTIEMLREKVKAMEARPDVFAQFAKPDDFVDDVVIERVYE